MPALVIGKFDQISVPNKVAIPRTTFFPLGKCFNFKASNTRENIPIWPKVEPCPRFYAFTDYLQVL